MNKQKKQVEELAQNVEELRRENVKLRGWLAEAIGKACFNCEEYTGHKEERCAKCRIHGMMEYQ